MRNDPTHSNKVKLAATKALNHSLEFTKANFEKEVGVINVDVAMVTLSPYRRKDTS